MVYGYLESLCIFEREDRSMSDWACGLELERGLTFFLEEGAVTIITRAGVVDWVLLCCDSVKRLIPSSAVSARLLPWRMMGFEEVGVEEESRGI